MNEWKNFNRNWVLMPTTGNNILGDASGEMGLLEISSDIRDLSMNSWYSSIFETYSLENPWIARSGDYSYGMTASLFATGE